MWTLLLLAADARPKPMPSGSTPSWSAAQATGAPNVTTPGDSTLAWASAIADGGPEWLELTFAKSVEVKEVRIRENDAPGAVSRVYAPDDDIVLWQGTDPTTKALTDFVVKPKQFVLTNRIRIELDTTRAQGWNEIDAVQLVGSDGSRQWATSAKASSEFASGKHETWVDPLMQAMGKNVSLTLQGGGTVQGMFEKIEGEFMLITVGGRTSYVRREAVDAFSY